MKQSITRSARASVVAFILLCALTFVPLCEAHAQTETTGRLSAQNIATALTTATENDDAQETVSYKGVRIYQHSKDEDGTWSKWSLRSTVGDVSGAGLNTFALKLNSQMSKVGLSGDIRYRVYKRGEGWTGYAANGTSIQAAADVEAVSVKLSGAVAQEYDVYYRAFMSGSGWLPWSRNNTKSGVVKRDQHVLAFQVKMVPKTKAAFGLTEREASVLYQSRTVAEGWYIWKHDGGIVGKRDRKLAGLAVKVDADALSGGVQYRVYSKDSGWSNSALNGAYAKTNGKRVEAFRIKLTGKMAKTYDVYYRTRVEGVGWLDWAKNGATAGCTGYGLCCEALQVRLVKKGEAAPGNTLYPTVNKMDKAMTMDGIDISSWQAGIDLSQTQSDFVIIKATGGTAYVNPCYAEWADTTLASGKQLGFYHYAREASCPGSAVEEALHFVNAVKPYIGKAILVLDFEGGALEMGNSVKWAKKFMDTVYAKTGVRPLLYVSQNVTWNFDWSSVAKKYKLWVAQYLYRNFYTGYLGAPEGGTDLGYWSSAQIYQYSSTGSVSGYGDYLDLNKFYGSVYKWRQLAQKW